ncbi:MULTISPECIES: hypothetical protein [Pseudomonas]|nr:MULTISPECIES: hypothetical protein [Pseudomonas]MBP3860072.1 hypothetical protein [Pseudomonas sp.]MDY7572041.1 hypothetical protein [Pseudomonas sp. CCC4.1]MEB0143049.1 hypothetical protein [Pseudomonas sp. CCC4.1]OZY65172.1 hypothetical protein CJF37_05635 [Pseudomonas fragi]PAA44266.1 hypothetical protein CJU79_02840 [Pseudomonas fragi]
MRFSLMGVLFTISTLASAQTKDTPHTPPLINVEVGQPTFIHRLHYKKMYSEKPFEEAVLYYYDNGLYKIISPGENHYGVYVVEGDFTDDQYRISYISLPSPDWGGNVARHDLVFNKSSLTFEQKALAKVDQNIGLQNGRFVLDRNLIQDPQPITWETHAQR